MNQGFGSYFRNGWRAAFRVFSSRGKALLYAILYFLASFLGHLFFFSRPLFEISSLHLAMMSEKSGSFLISKSFEGANEGRRYKTLLLFNLLYELFLLAGLVLLGGVGAGLFFFGYYLGANPTLSFAMAFLFALPFWLSALAFLFLGLLIWSFSPAIVDENPEIELSDLFYNCFLSFKKKGKGGLFFLHFLPDLLTLAYLGVMVYLPFLLFNSSNLSLRVFGAFAVLILAFAFLLLSPYVSLSRSVSLYLYKKDHLEAKDYLLYQKNNGLVKNGTSVVEVFSAKENKGEQKVLYPLDKKENSALIGELYQEAQKSKAPEGNGTKDL
jgi:hypothetical protein